MIIWDINNSVYSREIEVGPITILKGSSLVWYKLVREVDDYFNNRQTTIEIFEGTQLLHKKDWECVFIPYDAHLQVEKISAKSPLKPIMDEICNDISYTNSYQNLLETWEELNEEMHFVQQKLTEYGLTIHLNALDLNNLKDFLYFKTVNHMITPIEYKKLILQLFVERTVDKKKLVILELPELYGENEQLKQFFLMVTSLADRGIRFIMVTNLFNEKGNVNYITGENIINEAKIEIIKSRIIKEVPFSCDEGLFNEAKNFLLKAVDNSSESLQFELNKINQSEIMKVILVIILHKLNLNIMLDIKGLSPNLQEFLKIYR